MDKKCIDPIRHYASLLENCIATKNLTLGKLLHSLFIKTALNFNAFLTNRLIHIYSKFHSVKCAHKVFDDLPLKNTHSYNTLFSTYARSGRFDVAWKLFDEMPQQNIVSYNSLISGLAHHGHYNEAIYVFRKMQRQSGRLLIDKFTLVGIASACAALATAEFLRQVHGVVVALGLELNLIMYNALVDAYGKCGDADASRKIFDRMPVRDVVSWTSLVSTYAKACRLEEARFVFDQMPSRNSVSWTAMINGHVQNGDEHGALKLFNQMREEGIQPSSSTYVSVLSACTGLALVEYGKMLHGYITRSLMGTENFNIFLYNALIDMFAKCGDMNSAVALFKQMPERDIVSWNSLVVGYAQNGYGKQSLFVFEEMIKAGIMPNHITFLGVLSACTHAGLVLEGLKFLDSMDGEYGVCPRSEHYAILIDALGRKNRLEEALQLIHSTSYGSGSIRMWGALLGACQIHGNLDLARLAAESLFNLEPGNAARYVTLSNIYAAAGRWNDARQMRALIKDRGLKKEPAYSWIEIRNTRHGFVAEDKSHVQTELIYERLAQLSDQMREFGYVPENRHYYIHDEENGLIG